MPEFEPIPKAPPEPRLLADLPKGPVLAFAPHPDDEAAGPGGALALHRRQGDPVRVVVATDGRAGDPDGRYAPEAYAELRREESRQGLAVLGVHDVEFWGFPDSCQLSASDIEMGTLRAMASLAAAKPSIVYLPWAQDGHPDHHALHHSVLRALDRSGFLGLALGYEVWNAMIPEWLLDVTAVMPQKDAAMRCHKSQLEYADFDVSVRGLNQFRAIVHGHGRGFYEAFCVVRGSLG